jgi:hypothetical protein
MLADHLWAEGRGLSDRHLHRLRDRAPLNIGAKGYDGSPRSYTDSYRIHQQFGGGKLNRARNVGQRIAHDVVVRVGNRVIQGLGCS